MILFEDRTTVLSAKRRFSGRRLGDYTKLSLSTLQACLGEFAAVDHVSVPSALGSNRNEVATLGLGHDTSKSLLVVCSMDLRPGGWV